MMERMGYCGEAQEFKDSLQEHGHSEYDYADRFNPADGAQHTYAGDRAEEAYARLEREQRYREEERRQEEQYYEEQQRQYYEQAQYSD